MAETVSGPQISVVIENQEEKLNKHQYKGICLAFCGTLLVVDIATDITVFAEYCILKNTGLAVSTLIIICATAVIVQVFSMKWHKNDNSVTVWHWVSHICLLGHFHRFLSAIRTRRSQNKIKSLCVARDNVDELHLLNLFRSFLQSAPQVMLQAYCTIELPRSYIRELSLAVSLISTFWSGLVYEQVVSRNKRCVPVLLKSSWYCAMLAARIAAILLFSVVFGLWTLIPLGIHWAAMTVWIISQKTELCPSKLEELYYNVVIGFVYCFCYFNLREGRTRYRLVTFYTLVVTQNLASLLLFTLVSDVTIQKRAWAVFATVCIVAGTIIGLCSMVTYYRWFHPNGPIKWKNMINDGIELNNKDSSSLAVRHPSKKKSLSCTSRTLKTSAKTNQCISSERAGSNNPEVNLHPDVDSTDKKLLLDHWIARSGTPTFVSAPVGIDIDDSCIEIRTVENTPQSVKVISASNIWKGKHNMKKQEFFSPTELNLKLSSIEHIERVEDLTSKNFTMKKRRGICSSDELKDGIHLDRQEQNINEKSQKSMDRGSELSQDTDSSNKKTSSDSIDMDLELSFSDINSSDINEFNENIVQKLCLSTLKNIKVGNQDADIQNIQRIALDILKEMYAKKGKHKKLKGKDILKDSKRDLDTPSEVLSVHDYENICAVNIAREAWGLRSWNVYSDIENWQHDGSVVRDRRRDTLTSASSEISSCISQELRNQILLAAQPPRVPTYSNIFVERFDVHNAELSLREDRSISKDDSENNAISPKSLHVDCTQNHLEPILEEIDDFGDVDQPNKQRLNSESSLVATIDEIRKSTITNSPRNVYHRRENIWDSPQANPTPKIETSLKRALWKEPSKFNPSNILETLPEKENISGEINNAKYLSQNNKQPDVVQTLAFDIESEKSGSQNNTKNHKITNLRSQMNMNSNKADEIHDLSNKDIDFLWQLVSDNNSTQLPVTSTEDTTNITSSLQSLIQKDHASASSVNKAPPAQKANVKKNIHNRPRRKFSLLREQFEPKINKVAEPKVLENKISPAQIEPTFDVRFQNILNPGYLNYQNELTNDSLNYTSPKQREPELEGENSPINIKEKRSLFLKQVLSPPKFSNKTKRKT